MAKNTLTTTAALRKKKDKELHDMLRDLYSKYSAIKVAIHMKKEKNTAGVRELRVMIARVKTVMGEKRDMQLLQVKTGKHGKENNG